MISIVLTGASGMVGEGVLLTSLSSPAVSKVLVVGRRPWRNGIVAAQQHLGPPAPKLTELHVPDLADLSSVEAQLKGFDACFFCAGVSSLGKTEEEYTKLAYDLTLSFARTVARLNPGMTFTYVSGTGTDGSEQGKVMWAKVKGKTENHLRTLGFKANYAFRPGLMKPVDGQKNSPRMLRMSRLMYPFFKIVASRHTST